MDIDIPVQEEYGMLHIQCLGIGLVMVYIDQNNFLTQPLADNAVRCRGTDVAGAYDYDLGILEAHILYLHLAA
jgi:hypothetical protein